MRNAVSLNPKPSRQRLRVQAGHQIDLLQVAVVDLLDLLAPRRVVGQLVERLDRRACGAAGGTGCSAARRARGRGGCRSPRGRGARRCRAQILQWRGIVVQRDRAGMRDAERVEEIRHREPLGDRRRARPRDLVAAAIVSSSPPVASEWNAIVVGNERVHPVDRRRTPRSARRAPNGDRPSSRRSRRAAPCRRGT